MQPLDPVPDRLRSSRWRRVRGWQTLSVDESLEKGHADWRPSPDPPGKITHFRSPQSAGRSLRQTAAQLGRHVSPISRALRRHCGQRGDLSPARSGQGDESVPGSLRHALEDDPRAVAEQVAGRSRQPGEGMAGRERVYQPVRADRRAGGAWYRHLRRRGKQPNGRGEVIFPVGWTWPNDRRSGRTRARSRTGSWNRSSGYCNEGAGALGGSGLEVQGADVGGMEDRGGRGRGHRAADGAVSGPGAYRYGGPRLGVRGLPGDRRYAGSRLGLCHPLPFLGAWPERADPWSGAPGLAKRDGLPSDDGGADSGGGGPDQPPTLEGAGGSDPSRGIHRRRNTDLKAVIPLPSPPFQKPMLDGPGSRSAEISPLDG